MDVATLECGAKQIILNHDDNFQVLFLNEAEVEVAQVYSLKMKSCTKGALITNHLHFTQIQYDENNNRFARLDDGHHCYVNLGVRKEELDEWKLISNDNH